MVSAYIPNYLDGTVSVIDTSTDTVLATVTVGTNPIAVAVSPDGSKAYISNYTGSTVSVINTSTNTVSTTFFSRYAPQGLAVSQDGKKLYVTNDDNLGHGIIMFLIPQLIALL